MLMRQLLICLIALPLLVSQPAFAKSETSSPADLIGRWVVDCDAWGAAGRCTIDWAEGLHASHMTIHYRIANAATDSTIFEGTGTYRQTGEASLDGYWSDSQGAIHPLSASWDNNALTTHWGIAGETVGRTRYSLNEDGSLTVTDWQLTEAGWAQFMEARYSRSNAE